MILAASIFFWFKKQKEVELSFFIFLSIASAFMGTAISTFVWNYFPSSFIIFPFRFLSILPMGLAFLGAYIISSSKRYKYFVFAVIAAICFYSTSFFLTPTKYLPTNDDYYLNNFASTTANNEYTPKWVRVRPDTLPAQRALIASGDGRITFSDFNSKRILISENGNKSSVVRINIVYFPGWQAFVNGIQGPISYQNINGVMLINVPSGSNSIVLEYNEIGVHLYSDLLSILGFLILISLFAKEKINGSKKS